MNITVTCVCQMQLICTFYNCDHATVAEFSMTKINTSHAGETERDLKQKQNQLSHDSNTKTSSSQIFIINLKPLKNHPPTE